jgi:uncharacterized cupredoxin-like copper-binding protein
MHKHPFVTLVIAATMLIPSAQAADTGHGAHSSHGATAKQPAAKSTDAKNFGKPGNAKQVTRTIAVDMSDTMRYTPSALTIAQGETVKFELRNSGKVMHEFVLGTLADLKTHAEEMKKSPKMAHGGAYMVHVAPGKTGSAVWEFTKAGEFHFGCLLPGHFEAGMVGQITVTAKK